MSESSRKPPEPTDALDRLQPGPPEPRRLFPSLGGRSPQSREAAASRAAELHRAPHRRWAGRR